MKEEGFNVLYSGLAPALLRQAIYGTVKYGLYYTIKDVVGGEESPLKNVSIAVVAGSVSASIANPTDVLKVRLQSKSAPVVSPIPGPDKKVIRVSLYNCFRDIYVREGVGGLWRGMMPTASRAALVAGVQVQVLHVQLKPKIFSRNQLLKLFFMLNLPSQLTQEVHGVLLPYGPYETLEQVH